MKISFVYCVVDAQVSALMTMPLCDQEWLLVAPEPEQSWVMSCKCCRANRVKAERPSGGRGL